MEEGIVPRASAGSGRASDPQRRRSPRLASPPAAAGKRITFRKIAPRKTVAELGHDKENTPARRSMELRQKTPKVSTPDLCPGPGPARRASSSGGARRKPQAAIPSPILPSPVPHPPILSSPVSSPTVLSSQQPAADPADSVWSKKVRRSYSRLSGGSAGGSPGSPGPHDALFGFGELQTPEVRRVGPSKAGLGLTLVGGSESGLSSFMSLLEAEESFPEPDTNIPGVPLVKEKRKRRKKVQQIDTKELDVLAAEMNAEFQEAEEFELLVE
ncbi:sororin [Cololabis saira]|uniref:sororin n=1 Tax=Cololabis saira TaxID=129043 RepID=UPI002AD4DA9E|nr:sororin [Cololabis saira]